MGKDRRMMRGLFIISLLVISIASFAQKIETFDENKDEQISKAEYLKFLVKKKGVTFNELDRDEDGELTDAEIEFRFFSDLLNLKRSKGDFPIALESLIEKNKEAGSGFFKRNGILLRSSYDEISLNKAGTPFSKGDPAIFSYSRNNQDTVSIWTAQGAVMRPFEILKNESNNNRYMIAPSVTFNRKISSNEKGEANSLIFRLGGGAEWDVQNDWYLNMRIGFAYATDFSFDTEVNAVELEFEPSNVFKGMGVYRNISKSKFNVLRYTWRIYSHFEIGNTSDIGSNEILRDGSFARIGLKGEFGLLFRKQLEFKLKGGYLYGLSGEPENSELLSVKSIYRLDDTGNLTLNFEYQKGNIPLLQEEINNWTFGLGIKF